MIRLQGRTLQQAVYEIYCELKKSDCRTIQLRGLPSFHGTRTLSETQVRKCVHLIPHVNQVGGNWIYDHQYWHLSNKEMGTEFINNIN